MSGHYCINCGTRLGPVLMEGQELEGCEACGFVLWRDPKVVTMVVVESGPEIVLGRRAIEPGYGLWCLPGGFVNHDEHPAAAAARECLEEISVNVDILGLLGVYHVSKAGAPSMVALAYRARLDSEAEPRPGPEMLEVQGFRPDRLPSLAFPSHAEALRDWSSGRTL